MSTCFAFKYVIDSDDLAPEDRVAGRYGQIGCSAGSSATGLLAISPRVTSRDCGPGALDVATDMRPDSNGALGFHPIRCTTNQVPMCASVEQVLQGGHLHST
jgi:hypothetical protein